MNRLARKGLVTAMVAGGVLASAGFARADAAVTGDAAGPPGVLAGSVPRLPLDLPLKASGHGTGVVGLGNAAGADTAVGQDAPPAPAHTPIPAPPGSAAAPAAPMAPEPAAPALADTGTGGTGMTVAGGLALLLGGTALRRGAGSAVRR
ncbi:chaplin family protein [Streptomyces sp. NBC_01477]|uniref:chaplin family protein n=1 Tax=Streptomyces sp. NBC_01477 TaxID=2976015 RepID=UPI002E30484A|nr:chaplin family protein [Streptomyces sp. NBC_01477]